MCRRMLQLWSGQETGSCLTQALQEEADVAFWTSTHVDQDLHRTTDVRKFSLDSRTRAAALKPTTASSATTWEPSWTTCAVAATPSVHSGPSAAAVCVSTSRAMLTTAASVATSARTTCRVRVACAVTVRVKSMIKFIVCHHLWHDHIYHLVMDRCGRARCSWLLLWYWWGSRGIVVFVSSDDSFDVLIHGCS